MFSDGAVSLHTRSLKYGKVSRVLFAALAPLCGSLRNLHLWVCEL